MLPAEQHGSCTTLVTDNLARVCCSVNLCLCVYSCCCSGVGAVFNIICLIMCFIFPSKSRAATKAGEETTSSSDGGCCGLGGGRSTNGPITSDSTSININKDVDAIDV